MGEPDYPVAAVERGRRVPVRSDEVFAVVDHDFTKFSLIPSVIFVIDIPEDISDSLYHGKKTTSKLQIACTCRYTCTW